MLLYDFSVLGINFEIQGTTWTPKPHLQLPLFNEVKQLLAQFATREHERRCPDKNSTKGTKRRKPRHISPAQDPVVRRIKQKVYNAMLAEFSGGDDAFENLLT